MNEAVAMRNQGAFIVNPRASDLDLEDGILERLSRAHGVTVALMSDDAGLSDQVTSDALWDIQRNLEDVQALFAAYLEREKATPKT